MPVIGTGKSVTGIAWPWVPSSGGIPAQVSDQEAVAANLLILYSTQPGDDKTAPTFGLNLNSFVFETTGALLDNLVKVEVIRSTELWEPRVQVIDVVTVADNTDDGTVVTITVDYYFIGVSSQITFQRSTA
jgi:phage baseplate assembly protein W